MLSNRYDLKSAQLLKFCITGHKHSSSQRSCKAVHVTSSPIQSERLPKGNSKKRLRDPIENLSRPLHRHEFQSYWQMCSEPTLFIVQHWVTACVVVQKGSAPHLAKYRNILPRMGCCFVLSAAQLVMRTDGPVFFTTVASRHSFR
jgi:hypothetical protein